MVSNTASFWGSFSLSERETKRDRDGILVWLAFSLCSCEGITCFFGWGAFRLSTFITKLSS